MRCERSTLPAGRFVAVLALLCVFSTSVSVAALDVAVLCVPFYGHFMPLKAIGEQLAMRGHRVTLFVENTNWCASAANMSCVQLQKSGTFPQSMFQRISEMEHMTLTWPPLVMELETHHETQLGHVLDVFNRTYSAPASRPDLVLVDTSTQVGFSVASYFGIPLVASNPMLTRGGIGETWLPWLGTGHPRRLSFPQRLMNYVLQLIVGPFAVFALSGTNAVRAAHGIRPYRSLAEFQGADTLSFTPTVWGYDIPQRMTSSNFPLGLVVPLHEVAELEPELQQFLESRHCATVGAVYINFGTLATPNDRLIDKLIDTFTTMQTRCIVWKVPEPARRAKVTAALQQSEANRQGSFVTERFASPLKIMSHRNTLAFLTHCGDTSLGEAIHAQVPLIGIPFFADQGDVCQRVSEAGIGVCIPDKQRFAASDVSRAIDSVFQDRSLLLTRGEDSNSSFLSSLRRVKKVADFYGGAPRGAQIIETYAQAGLLSPPFRSWTSPASISDPTEPTGFPLVDRYYDTPGLVMYLVYTVLPWTVFWIAVTLGAKRVGLAVFKRMFYPHALSPR